MSALPREIHKTPPGKGGHGGGGKAAKLYSPYIHTFSGLLKKRLNRTGYKPNAEASAQCE